MTEMTKQSRRESFGTVLAAVAFDKYTQNVLDSAESFCKATNSTLHLVHVCEPDASLAYFMPYFDEAALFEIDSKHVDRASQAADKRLGDMASSIDKDVKTSHRVVHGIPADAIMKEAERVNASLLLLGVGLSQHRLLPRGWSTALSLMAESNVPVLVVDKDTPLVAHSRSITLLLADDLADDHQLIAPFTSKLANAFSATIHHLHVTGFQHDTLAAALDSAMAAGHVTNSSGIDAKDLLRIIEDKIHDKLTARMTPYIDPPQGGNVRPYKAYTLAGDPRDVISQEAERLDASFVIFGRHRNKKPFGIGQVPFRAMVSQRRPVIIVPISKK